MRSFALLLVIFTACTKENPKLPSLEEYKANTKIMLGVTEKFLHEEDVPKLHKAAVSFQLSRAVTCYDIKEECSTYTELIRKFVDYSKDGRLTKEEKIDLTKHRQQLIQEIQETHYFLESRQSY